MRPRWMPFRLAAVLVAVSPICTVAQTSWSDTVPDSVMPAEIGPLRLTETFHYPEAHLGTLYRYRNDTELRPDVYIYPVSRQPESGGAFDPAREEGMNFGRVLTAQKMRGQFDAFEILTREAQHLGEGRNAISGWHVHAVLERRGEKHDTHLFVYTLGDQTLKVRATYSIGSVEFAALDSFVGDLLDELIATRR